MHRAFLVSFVVVVWLAAVLARAVVGDALGAYAVLPLALAVAATGAATGLVGGVVAALVAGVVASAEAVGLRPGRADLVAAVVDGALLAPASLLALGAATGAWRRLVGQLRLHRAASDRAQFDVLTGLLNRDAFERRLGAWSDDGGPTRSGSFAVLFVDLDRFKFVNDTFGHTTGDRLLVAIADALREAVREDDLVARLGGDEFVVALGGVRDAAAAGAVADKLCRRIATPFEIDGKVLHVSASVGIALYPQDGRDVAALTKSADGAMYAVKTGGKNAFTFTDPALRERQARRLAIERQLRFALHDQEFQVAYQPQWELATGRLVGFEALLRWENRELGAVSPSEFVPIAEDAGLIVPIGHWLLREACHQARAWSALGASGLTMAVNVSTLQFRQPSFLRQVEEALRDTRLPPAALELEVTESVLIEDFDRAMATLRRLDRLGVRTALDDFGTGYSSLAYLQRLPVSSLKIDRSFVAGLAASPSATLAGGVSSIVDAIAVLGRKLGKTVVAEGVETEAQARHLQRLGIDRVQGYLYARPLAAAQAERLVLRAAAAQARAASGPEPVLVGGDAEGWATTVRDPRWSAGASAPRSAWRFPD